MGHGGDDDVFKRMLSRLYELDELFRFHQLGFVSLWPLLGLLCTSTWDASMGIAIVGVSFFFNSFGVILNDVVDLPVDRTAPLRQRAALVRGVVTPKQALSLALLQIPLMLTAHIVGGLSPHAIPLLLAVTASLAVYDLWSKTCRLPLLVDAALALSGFLYVLYGARVAEPSMPLLVWPVAVSSAAFLLYVNAFSNGLRDLDNDLSCHRRTTPIWLGCRGTVDGRVHITRAMYAYAGLLQSVLIAAAVYAQVQLAGSMHRRMWLSVGVVVAASALNAFLFLQQYNVPTLRWNMLMRLHLLLLPLPLMLAFASQMTVAGRWALFAIYFGPVIVLAPLLVGMPAVDRLSSEAELSAASRTG